MRGTGPDMKDERLKAVFARSLEGVALVVLVLLFFSAFLGIMNVLFPTGTGLKDIVGRERSRGAAADLRSAAGAAPGKAAAMLTQVHNTVKSKREDAIAWSAAQTGTPLYDQDAVQTLQRSSAMLTFDENSTLELGANTLMIIKSIERDVQARKKRSLLLMVDGDLRGKIGGAGQEALQLEIATPNATARIDTSRLPAQKGDFKVSINPDKSSTITVFQGAAQVLVGGKEVLVESNKSLTVDADNTMDGPKTLPQTVELIAPDPSGRFLYRDLSPRIKFRWKPAPQATKYHFVIARDPQFQDILLDERLAQPEFMHGKLPHSVYYWRVSALNHWQEGLFSDAWQFTTVQKRSAPDLVVNFPPKRVNEKRCMITGSVEPGARVFIMGRRVTIDGEGNFKHTIELARRINLLVVEAIDAAGNVSYRSRLVHGAF
jgi:hypothetical protein